MLHPFREFLQSQPVRDTTFWSYTTPRIISIESSDFQKHSIKPYLSELTKGVGHPYELDHNTVGNGDDFIRNLKSRKDYNSAPFYYLSFHGEPASIVFNAKSGLGLDDLVYPFENDRTSNSIIYLSSCSSLQGDDGKMLADHLLKNTKCRAVIGYSKDMNWFDALFIDLLFIHKFFSHENPLDGIEEIYQEVLREYSPAKEAGLTLFKSMLREGSNTGKN